MLTHTVDSSRARKRMRAMRKGLPSASRASIATAGGLVARYVYDNAPEATRRYKKGAHDQVMGCAALGGEITPTAAPVLRAAPDRAKQLEVMQRSVERAMERERRALAWVRNLEARPGGPVYKRRRPGRPKGSTWRTYRKALRKLDRAGDVTDEAIERYEEFAAAGADAPILVVRGRRHRKGRFGKSQLASTRDRVYGGSAEYQLVGGNLHRLTLRHREPHARFVERRHRLYRLGQTSASFTGAERVRTKHRRALKEAGA